VRKPIWVKAAKAIPVPKGPGKGRRNPITAERPALVDGKDPYILGRLRDKEVVEITEAEARKLLAKAKAEAEVRAEPETAAEPEAKGGRKK